MLPIQRKISLVNFSKGNNPKYIVLHDVGALGQAWANANYFYSVFRGASAGYFVDDANILQVVEDYNSGWHVGDDKDDSDDGINNFNSIGIEMCLNSSWKVTEKTKQNTIDLVKYLQKKHNIPNSRVVRHYDASGKRCPGSMASNNWAEWKAFYARICGSTATVPVTTTPTVSTTGTKKVRVNTAVLNVRSGAGATYKINAQVKSGEVYTITETVNGWGRLKSGAGWISMGYVDVITEGVSVTQPAVVAKPVVNTINWIAESGTFYPNTTLNVRSEPNDKAEIVAQYHAGQSVTYNAKWSDGYYTWIRYTGGSGLSRYMVSRINGVRTGTAV